MLGPVPHIPRDSSSLEAAGGGAAPLWPIAGCGDTEGRGWVRGEPRGVLSREGFGHFSSPKLAGVSPEPCSCKAGSYKYTSRKKH